MLFNLHHGQMRFASPTAGSKEIFRNKAPKKSISFAGMLPGQRLVTYRADKLGNVEVVTAKHIDSFVGLGFPICKPVDGTRPIGKEDLIYPNLDMKSEYWRKINEAKGLRSN